MVSSSIEIAAKSHETELGNISKIFRKSIRTSADGFDVLLDICSGSFERLN